ncbi:MAG: hypothetical protein JWL97_4374 [Gemmatimonadales bacterium]|nr:hypothetical protein [Gemmatimonadales bacterium]
MRRQARSSVGVMGLRHPHDLGSRACSAIPAHSRHEPDTTPLCRGPACIPTRCSTQGHRAPDSLADLVAEAFSRWYAPHLSRQVRRGAQSSGGQGDPGRPGLSRHLWGLHRPQAGGLLSVRQNHRPDRRRGRRRGRYVPAGCRADPGPGPGRRHNPRPRRYVCEQHVWDGGGP